MFGGKKEHPKTPASMGHAMQAMLKKNNVWSKMVYIDSMGHVPAKSAFYSVPKLGIKRPTPPSMNFSIWSATNKEIPKAEIL